MINEAPRAPWKSPVKAVTLMSAKMRYFLVSDQFKGSFGSLVRAC